MPNLSEISNGTKLLLVAGLLLFVDMFFAWQKVSVKVFGVEAASAKANAWHGFWGVVMGLLLIALLVWVGLQAANVKLGFELPVGDGLLTLGLGVIVFVFALLKNLTDDYSTIWAWIGVVLAALVAVGAWLRAQEVGGVAMPGRDTSAGSSGMGSPSGMSSTPAPGGMGTTAPPASTGDMGSSSTPPQQSPPPPPAGTGSSTDV